MDLPVYSLSEFTAAESGDCPELKVVESGDPGEVGIYSPPISDPEPLPASPGSRDGSTSGESDSGPPERE